MEDKINNALLNEVRVQTVLLADICGLMTSQLSAISMLLMTQPHLKGDNLVSVTKLCQTIAEQANHVGLRLSKQVEVRRNMNEIELEFEGKIKKLQDSRVEKLRELTKAF